MNELKDLRKIVGVGAVKSLRLGKSLLKIWRRSSPHNWWIENTKGNILWHSWPGEPRPSLEAFSLVRHSRKKIWTGHSENYWK